MEWYKLFCNSWFKKNIQNQIKLYKEYLLKKWWDNATEQEKQNYTNIKRQKREMVIAMLALASNFKSDY